MNLINSSSNHPSLSAIEAQADQILRKLQQLQSELESIQTDRTNMESKISDAQTRIQKILNKLPKATDTRQMNLLDGSLAEKSNSENFGGMHE